MEKRKRYTIEEKTKILRDIIENNLAVSAAAEKYNLYPKMIYRWKKELFESTPEALSNTKKKNDKQLIEAELRISELEALLSKRESLIAELVEDNISLKKKSSGENLIKNGLSRK